MSTEYSDRKIKEIMSKVAGQGKLAEQAITALIQRDPIFLQSLVQPYLDGIILHAIERARKTTGLKELKAVKELPKKIIGQKNAPQKPSVSGNTMDNLMKAWAKEFEDDAPQKPGAKKVSQNHIDVLKSLIKKN